jgi:hypothetical protein
LEDGAAVLFERREAGLRAHDPVLTDVVIAHDVSRDERLAGRGQLRQLEEQRVAVERHGVVTRDERFHPGVVFDLFAIVIERELLVVVRVVTCRSCSLGGCLCGLGRVLVVCERGPVRAVRRWLCREDEFLQVLSLIAVIAVIYILVVVLRRRATATRARVDRVQGLVVDPLPLAMAERVAEDALKVLGAALVPDLHARALALAPRLRHQQPQILAALRAHILLFVILVFY